MRPHVLRLPHHTTANRSLERELERIKRAVAVVGFETEGIVTGERPFSRHRIQEVRGVFAKQMMAHAADISGLTDESIRQLLLEHEVPVLITRIFAIARDGLRAETKRLKLTDEGSDGK